MSNVNDRIARTRRFFQYDSWSWEAPEAWSHVLTGACDDTDLNGDNMFTMLDVDNMFSDYMTFCVACNDAFHFLIDNVDSMFKLAGFIYIDGETGAVEFAREDSELGHERAEWLLKCHQNMAGTLLRAVVDNTGSIGIELVD